MGSCTGEQCWLFLCQRVCQFCIASDVEENESEERSGKLAARGETEMYIVYLVNNILTSSPAGYCGSCVHTTELLI